MVGNEIVDELKANLTPAHIAIPLPVTVNCLLEVVDRLAFIPLPGSQPGKLEVDESVALLRLQQRVEVNRCLLNPSGGGERLGQLDGCAAIIGSISQRRAEGIDRRLRLVVPQSLVAPLQPSGR